MDDYAQAAAAGLIQGILAAWKRGANPGALDDMTESPWSYTENGAHVTLLFGNGEVFAISCTRVDA